MVSDVSFAISIFMMSERQTLSNALVKSMNQTCAGVLNSIDFSFSGLIMNMASVVDLFHLKPCCSSLFIICVSSFSFKMPVKSFMLVFSSVIPLQLSGY